MSAPLLFPVGHLWGAVYPQLGSAEHTLQVRVGPEVVQLDDRSFAVWALAHGLPGRGPEQPWTRSAVEAAATAQGLPDAGRRVAELLADRLLVEVVPEQGRAFASGHRVLPLVEGLGNDPEATQLWSIGLPGHPLVTVTSTVADLFTWGHLDTDLWSACQAAAVSAAGVGRTEPVAVDPHVMLPAVLTSLHQLLTPGAVCLDTRVAG